VSVIREPQNTAKGGNAGRNRTHNRRVVLDYVRTNEPAGRAEIARSCGLSVQAVSNITEALESDGLLRAVGHATGRRGKPAAQYTFNPDGAFAVGIEMRPDALICAVVNLKGARIFSDRCALADASPMGAIPAVRDMVARAVTGSGRERSHLLGVGVVMPGPFGVSGLSDTGGAVLPGWDGVDGCHEFEAALDCPVIVENDATAAAISERVAGVASAIDTFCFIYFGAGLGLGVITDGQAQRGAFGNFGEIGHIITQAGGTQCSCGNRGCLETYASRMSARKFVESQGFELPDSAAMLRLLQDRNPALLDWIGRAAGHLSQAISILENIFDPETIILGGAMPDAVTDALIARLELPTGSVANRGGRAVARVMRGSSGQFTAAIGGAAMIIHNTTTPSMALFN
jgi:predicted NBD/HSP70 family sugar kinase